VLDYVERLLYKGFDVEMLRGEVKASSLAISMNVRFRWKRSLVMLATPCLRS
jgi:hypothetical protein